MRPPARDNRDPPRPDFRRFDRDRPPPRDVRDGRNGRDIRQSRPPPPPRPSYDRFREQQRDREQRRPLDGDPTFVPRNFLFDDRETFSEEGGLPEEGKSQSRLPRRTASPDRWGHDKFDLDEEADRGQPKEADRKAENGSSSSSSAAAAAAGGGSAKQAEDGEHRGGGDGDAADTGSAARDSERSGSPARDGAATGDQD